MDHHVQHGTPTRAERNAAKPAMPGLWPLWLYLGLAVAFAISMAVDGRSGAVADLVLMLVWVVAYILIVASLIMIPLCLTDKGRDGRRDMRGVLTFLIALVISLIIAFFVAGPLRLY